MRENGLYRIAQGSEIRKDYYDYDTHKLGPYSFTAPIEYLDKYHATLPVPHMKHLYKNLLGNPSALGTFFTNNDYVGILFEKKIIYSSIYREENLLVYDLSSSVHPIPTVPVGYVKTRTECVSVYTPPYILPYSEDLNCVHLNGNWIKVKDKPVMCRDVGLYKSLLRMTNKEAVYKAENGDLIFL